MFATISCKRYSISYFSISSVTAAAWLWRTYATPSLGRVRRSLRGIAKRFNLNLAEQIINTISIAGISTKRLKSYLRFPDAERYAKATADTDIVLFAAHHGSWEYLTAVGCYDKGHRLISVYHPLSDNALDDVFKRLRHCENMEPCAAR